MDNLNHLNSRYYSLSTKTERKKTNNMELHSTAMAVGVVVLFFIISLFVC